VNGALEPVRVDQVTTSARRSIGAIACLAVLCAASAANARVPKEAQSAAAKAQKAAKAGMHDEALDLYISAFELSDSPQFLANAAAVEVVLGHYERAYKRYEKALAHRKTKRRLRRRLGKALEQLEPHYQSAVEQRKNARNARDAAAKEAEQWQKKAARKAAAKAQKSMLQAARDELEKRRETEAQRRDKERHEENAARLQAEREWKGVAGWSALAVGALVAGGGAWALLRYQDGQAQLNDELGATNAGNRFEGLDYATYKSRQANVNQQALFSTIGFAVGGTALLAGAWFTLSRPSAPSVSLAPLPGGGMLFASGAL
jgi:hypothetical protein